MKDPYIADAALMDKEPTSPANVRRQISFTASTELDPSPASAVSAVVPEVAPKKPPSLVPDVLSTLNTSAIKKRIDRLMAAKADGTYKVPAELVKEWQSGDQTRLINEFTSAGLDKEQIIRLMLYI